MIKLVYGIDSLLKISVIAASPFMTWYLSCRIWSVNCHVIGQMHSGQTYNGSTIVNYDSRGVPD